MSDKWLGSHYPRWMAVDVYEFSEETINKDDVIKVEAFTVVYGDMRGAFGFCY